MEESALLTADNAYFKHINVVISLLRQPLFEFENGEMEDQTEFEKMIFKKD